MDERRKSPASLRARAEQKTGPKNGDPVALLSAEAARELVHELQLHQVELEMQNEELRSAAVELEASRERYFDLYDLAPVGYLTLSDRGLILEANLTAAGLLGETRSLLIRQPLSRFFLPEDAGTYFQHRGRLLKTLEQQACDLQLVTTGGAVSWVRLEMMAVRSEDGATSIRAALSDVSKRKLTERLLRDRTASLEAAVAKMETLAGLLPVCAGCARIRDPAGTWHPLDKFVARRHDDGASRLLCGECGKDDPAAGH